MSRVEVSIAHLLNVGGPKGGSPWLSGGRRPCGGEALRACAVAPRVRLGYGQGIAECDR